MSGDWLTPAVIRRQAFIGEVALSPDGSLVAYTRRTIRRDRDETRLWLVPFTGGRPRRLTGGAHRDTRPRFAPDGRSVAFISDRAGRSRVHIIPVGGGEPRRITRFRGGVTDYAWQPDGSGLIVLVEDDQSSLDQPPWGRNTPTARVIRRADWRYDGEGLRRHPTHLHAVALTTSGRSHRLTGGAWFASRPRVSPDGTLIAFLADLHPGADTRPRPQVYAVRPDQDPLAITDLPGGVSRFAFDADGALICVAYQVEEPFDDEPTVLWRVDRDGTARLLPGPHDRFCATTPEADLYDWLAARDDAGRVSTVMHRGRNIPYRFDDDAAVALVDEADDPVVLNLAAADTRVAAVMSLGVEAPELYVLEPDSRPRRLTRHGSDWLRKAGRPSVQEIEIPGPAGPIPTFLVAPDTTQALPLVLDIHGGPTGAWGPAPPLEAFLLAAAGYRVALPNIRGSYHQGRASVRPLRGDWGGCDAEDCHAVCDRLIEQGLADPGRLGAIGISYGGFLVNWLVATSQRFSAAVSENGVTNQVSAWANSDTGPAYCVASGLGDPTTPEGAEELWRCSPLRHVAAIRTPLLLLQAEQDRRCPPCDAEQMFVALRWLGRVCEYVLYPEEGHTFQGDGRPDRRRDRHQRVLDWFARHLPVDAARDQ